LGERVRALVAAAEGMAAAVRSDADNYAAERRREADAEVERRLREASEQADALLAERLARIADLSDRIMERAEAVLERLESAEEVRAQLTQLTRALGDTAERISRELGEVAGGGSQVAEPEPEAEPEHPMADEVRPLRPPSEQPRPPLRQVPPAHVPRDDPDTRLDDARLVALQMAVAGRSRDEVGAHLRQAFDVRDPEPILDHVFAEGFPPRPEPPSGA
jgi:multidrug efflux pump subunit AcrA (membrane-fusion protein)